MYNRETNKKTLDYMQAIRGFSDQSYTKYESDLNLYSEYFDMSLEELLEEAEEDEDKNIRMRKRRINDKILRFQKHLEEDKVTHPITKKTVSYAPYTINNIITSVKNFYTCYDIQVPMIRRKRAKLENQEDIITKREIRLALQHDPNQQHKAIILLLSCSGLDVDSLLKLTVKDYTNGVKMYSTFTPSSNLKSFFEDLNRQKDVVATLSMERPKTHYEHIFFFSPEACHALNYSLLERIRLGEDLKLDSPLITIGKQAINKFFVKLNDKLGFGWTSRGTRRRFRPHGLRAFFASTLVGATIDGMMIDSMIIEFMLGHTIPATTAAYYKKKPELLKNVYVSVMGKLSMGEYYKVKTINSPEYERMKNELERYKVLEAKIEKLERLQGLYSKLD